MNAQKCIIEYMDFIDEYGIPYTDSEVMRVITDSEELRIYSEETGKKLGLIYKSEYNILVVDLVENIYGERFTYERIVKTHKGNSVVVIPMLKDDYVFIKQYRHSLGRYQIAFPRGYGEPNITVEENVRKEVLEELNAETFDISVIGTVIADSGICGEQVNIAECKIENYYVNGVYEGIKEVHLFSEESVKDMIKSGQIDDGFTLSAWALLQTQKA